MPTYLFYDIETTGLNPCFDQILQFAAIRTDLKLRELERYEINIRLNPDIIPSPYALLTHQMGVQACQQGIKEIDAIQQIYQLVNQPGTISVGYNTLSFDDEFLRFAFYRHLLPPYTHQYANQCGRMDIYPLTVMYWLYKPQVLQWPHDGDNKPILKLAHLSELNQLATGAYHTAIVDVIATVELAKRLSTQADMWNYLIGYFDKQQEQARIQQLPTILINQQATRHGLMVYPKLGATAHYQAPVVHLGAHWHYKNQELWLRLDTEELSQTTADQVKEFTWVIRKKKCEQELLLPPTRFSSQAPERQQLVAHNLAWVQANPELFAAIAHYHRDYRYPTIPNVDADAALYTLDFTRPQEETQYAKFHAAAPGNKWAHLSEFKDPVRQELARRLMGKHYYSYLPPQEQAAFDSWLASVKSGTATMVDFRGQPKYSIAQAQHDMATIRQNQSLNAVQAQLLQEWEDYFMKT